MSYSFNVRVSSATLAAAAVSSEFDKIVEAQPIHAGDREQAEGVVTALLPLVAEPGEGQELSISVNGYISKSDDAVSGISVGASIHVTTKAE